MNVGKAVSGGGPIPPQVLVPHHVVRLQPGQELRQVPGIRGRSGGPVHRYICMRVPEEFAFPHHTARHDDRADNGSRRMQRQYRYYRLQLGHGGRAVHARFHQQKLPEDVIALSLRLTVSAKT